MGSDRDGGGIDIDVSFDRDTAIVMVRGDLDVATIEALDEALEGALARRRPWRLTLDLREVEFADARLLSLLARHRGDLRSEAPLLIEVLVWTPQVARLFTSSHFRRGLQIVPGDHSAPMRVIA